MKPQITYDQYLETTSKLEIRVGVILSAEPVAKSYGLKLTVAFADEDEKGEELTRTCFTNLGKTHKPEEFIGIACPFIMNVEPSEIKGVLSEVIIMVSDSEGKTKIDFCDASIGAKLM
jgi:methionyl-tRNA synthetase